MVNTDFAPAIKRHGYGSLDVASFSRTGPAGQAAVAGGGHGNVAGISDVFYQVRGMLPTCRAHNEQRMALAVVAFARAKPREILLLIVVTASHAGVCLTQIGDVR
jgi:TPP-dependent trihydroxycyclohexane-1,2-dione (THcHDO) dehydratase